MQKNIDIPFFQIMATSTGSFWGTRASSCARQQLTFDVTILVIIMVHSGKKSLSTSLSVFNIAERKFTWLHTLKLAIHDNEDPRTNDEMHCLSYASNIKIAIFEVLLITKMQLSSFTTKIKKEI